MRRGWLWLILALVVAILFVRACVRFVPGDAPARSPAAATQEARSLTMPVRGVTPAMLRDTFAEARGQDRRHDAIDIVAPRGTPVLAAAPGRVEKIFTSARGGRTVYVRSPDGRWIDYYAHLDSYAPGLGEGQIVGRGMVLGAVGSTGDAAPDAPHLHFAVNRAEPNDRWYQGTPVNPYPLLTSGRR